MMGHTPKLPVLAQHKASDTEAICMTNSSKVPDPQLGKSSHLQGEGKEPDAIILLKLEIASGAAVNLEKEVSTPLRYSCLESPVDGGAWWAAVYRSHRVWHDWSDLACMHALEKEMLTYSSILAWRIPGTEEPGGLGSMWSHRVKHDWSDLAAASGNHLFSGVHTGDRVTGNIRDKDAQIQL